MHKHRFDAIITVSCFVLLGYFAWHAWNGPRGYSYREALLDTLAQNAREFDRVHEQRFQLERKVELLKPDHVDQDMLDELARQRVGMVLATEVVASLPEISQGNP